MTEHSQQWRLDNVSCGYQHTTVIQPFSCTFSRGDFIAVRGANGSGKSCFLRTLSGDLPLHHGTITPPANYVPTSLGVVPQVTDIEPRLPTTLREMITLGAYGLPRSSAKNNFSAALDATALSTTVAKQSWSQSSGGERQRALIARALIRDPQFIILDEPTSHLDHDGSQHIMQVLTNCCRNKKCTVLCALHHQSFIEKYASHQLTLEHGHAHFASLSAADSVDSPHG